MPTAMSLRGENTQAILRQRDARMAPRDARSMQRIIIKQGYLKKLPNSAKLGSSFKKPERRWFIFGVISHSYPYLEYYESEECIFVRPPLRTVFLDSCLYLTRNQRTSRYNNVFTLVLRDRKLSLVADTRDVMSEWCRAIEDKLRSLHIIDTVGGDNDYVSVPLGGRRSQGPSRSSTVVVPSSSSRRQPSPPSTTPPSAANMDVSAAAQGGQSDASSPEAIVYETLRQDATVGGTPAQLENPYLVPEHSDPPAVRVSPESSVAQRPISLLLPEPFVDCPVFSGNNMTLGETRHENPSHMLPSLSAFLRQPASTVSQQSMSLRAEPRSPVLSSAMSISIPALQHQSPVPSPAPLPPRQPINTAAPLPPRQQSVSPPTSNATRLPPRQPSTPSSPPVSHVSPQRPLPYSLRLPSYEESVTVEGAPSSGTNISCEDQSETGATSAVPPRYDPPPSYVSDRMLELNANSPLKLRQVQQLKDEIENVDGIKVELKKSQLFHALALVDCFDNVWIAGWNQRTYPQFCNLFHIGDQLVSINGNPVVNAKMACKMLKVCADRADVCLVLKRLPYAVVCLVKRESSNFSALGLQMAAGTAEIIHVDPQGIAAQSGLLPNAANVDCSGACNWWITEVNHRPLNLYYRDNEVKQRLSAAGSHLSFVVQPVTLIVEMKRRLKTMKYFKDYLIE